MSLKLTKGIKWWHNNIVLKSEKTKFTNILKNNMQLGNEINGTKRTNNYRITNQTLNIKHLTCENWQTGVDNVVRIGKNLFSTHCCLAKVMDNIINNIIT